MCTEGRRAQRGTGHKGGRTAKGGGGGSWQSVVSIDFSSLTKMHQAAVLANHFCFSMVVGRGTNTLRIYTTMMFSVECKHSAMAKCPTASQKRKQQGGLDFSRLAQH